MTPLGIQTAPAVNENNALSSWAKAVANGDNGAKVKNGSKKKPPLPTTWAGTAAMQLSQQSNVVYLMTVDYLQNWLNWAYHLDSTAQEQLRLAAVGFGLSPPSESTTYQDPGPIDATALSVEGHPLVLSPLVQLHTVDTTAVVHLERSRSSSTHETRIHSHDNTLSVVAVPDHFYETLRATHGVLCEDGRSVTFQPPLDQRSPLILHHQVFGDDADVVRASCRPIEFRRKRIVVAETSKDPPQSLMDKLLAEEQRKVWQVEVHPLKIHYTIVDEASLCTSPNSCSSNSTTGNWSPHGFCLISQQAPASEALRALARVAVPAKATPQVRLWQSLHYPKSPTAKPFEYEAFNDLNELSGVIGEYSNRYLVEVRRSVNADWPLREYELLARLQVGDFCDAQDVAGKWYEAMVVGKDEASGAVHVHYIGWASKWNAKLLKMQSPSPLWTKTTRWRENIQVGQIVEVRDSSSIVERPKWYKGIVRKVGRHDDKPRELVGGAQLESFQGRHLLLLDQSQQVLVEVEQEKNSVTPALIKQATSPSGEDSGFQPTPPYLRWVNLYGEEVCSLGTHLKKDSTAPVTLRYEYDKNRKPVEVLKGHGAGFIRESLRGTPPAPGSVGLQNLGNSCYMNGIVQCLNHIEPLTQYFLQDKHLAELNRSNPLGSGGNVTLAYASLLKKMWSGEYCILAPRTLKQTVGSFAPQFDNSYQHDSQEFCQFLMDGLHEDLNRVKTKPYVEELEGFGMEDERAAVESWRKHLLRHDSIIVDHCQGMHRSHLTCPRCGRESIKFDIFSSISVPLVTNKNRTRIKLEDCLEKFMEGEQLDERNAWYCPRCRQHVCALKMIALWSVPDILILHLKRFTFDTCMTSGGMLRSKMDDTVEFPIEGFDLTKHILGPIDPDAPPVYKLFGVSEHNGPTANSGHYTATVRNSIDGNWYRCNDSHVGQTSGEASITSDAYLLFYQRAKGISKWGGMEKVMRDRNIDPYGGLQTDQEGFTKVNKKKKKKGE